MLSYTHTIHSQYKPIMLTIMLTLFTCLEHHSLQSSRYILAKVLPASSHLDHNATLDHQRFMTGLFFLLSKTLFPKHCCLSLLYTLQPKVLGFMCHLPPTSKSHGNQPEKYTSGRKKITGPERVQRTSWLGKLIAFQAKSTTLTTIGQRH